MSKQAFNLIHEGLKEALGVAQRESRSRASAAADASKIEENTGCSPRGHEPKT